MKRIQRYSSSSILLAIIFSCVFLLGATLRIYGNNWDQGMHLHPDERFLTMVTHELSWPASTQEYLSTQTSPLNPHNKKFSFYVYGTWPLIVTKYIATLVRLETYDTLPSVGRFLSVLCEILTLLVVYKMARNIGKSAITGVIAMFLYGTSVLPIQLAHFYTVDSFANFFISLSLLWLIEKRHVILIALAFGIAIAAKVSSILILPIVGLSYALQFPWNGLTKTIWTKRIRVVYTSLLFLIVTLVVVRITYPYVFTTGLTLNPKVLANWKELRSFEGVFVAFPPALQWIHTSIMLPAINIALFGLGIPQTILFFMSVLYVIHQVLQKKIHQNVILLISFIAIIFFYQGTQFAKPLRYFWPMFPSIAVLSAVFLTKFFDVIRRNNPRRANAICAIMVVTFLIYPVAFVHIYTKPHTRVAASLWIYEHVQKGSSISWEHWDDPLPLLIDQHRGNEYKTNQLPVFDKDSEEKWKTIEAMLSRSDYYILSSNRTYGAITNAAFRFPQTVKFYDLLFSGKLGFTLVAQFVSRPTLPLPFVSTCVRPPGVTYGMIAHKTDICSQGIQLIDDYADESFTVYDHPKVLIFQKTDQQVLVRSIQELQKAYEKNARSN